MIDFTSPLPSAVTVNGRDFFIKTDYRSWLEFDRILREKGIEKISYGDLLDTVLESQEMPYMDELEELFGGILKFYASENPLPKYSSGGNRVLDYLIDSDYIYAAFIEQYGIDLCEVKELHWHKFLALIRSISENTMLGKIMSYRGYKNSSKSYEAQMKELKYSWELPMIYTEEEKEQMKEFDDYFS